MKILHENPISWNYEIDSVNSTVWNGAIISFDFTGKSQINSLKSIKARIFN